MTLVTAATTCRLTSSDRRGESQYLARPPPSSLLLVEQPTHGRQVEVDAVAMPVNVPNLVLWVWFGGLFAIQCMPYSVWHVGQGVVLYGMATSLRIPSSQ